MARKAAITEAIFMEADVAPQQTVDVVGRWKAERFGEAITIGSVTIHTGDIVFADRDGIIIILQSVADTVTTKVFEVLQTENKVRTARVKQGMDPQQAYLKYGKF